MSIVAQRNGLLEHAIEKRRRELADFASQLEMPAPTHIGEGVFACIAEISPEAAEMILSYHHIPNNRGKKQGAIECYADDIARGRWRLSHQGIAFNQRELLFDGQNRLHGCIRAGLPLVTAVFFNVNDNAMVNTDIGRTRSAVDAAGILGITVDGVKVTTRLMASARIIAYGPDCERHTMENQMELLRHLREPLVFIHDQFPAHIGRITIGAVLGAIGRASFHVDRERLIKFCQILKSGFIENRETDSAAGLLYRFLLASNSAGGSNQSQSYFKTENAIDKFIRKTNITKLYEGSQELYELPLSIKVKLGGMAAQVK